MMVFTRIIFLSPPYKNDITYYMYENTPRQDKQESDKKKFPLPYTGKFQ